MNISQAMNKVESRDDFCENIPFDWAGVLFGAEESCFIDEMIRPWFVNIIFKVDITKLHVDVIECRVWKMIVSQDADDIAVTLSTNLVYCLDFILQVLVCEKPKRTKQLPCKRLVRR